MPTDPHTTHKPTADETWQTLRVSVGRTIPRDLRRCVKSIRHLQHVRRAR